MAFKTIIIKGEGFRNEAKADAAITPGHLVERTTTGVAVHSTAGGNAQRAFAVEDDLQGNGIDDVYIVANQVQFNVMHGGEVVFALIKDGETIVIGDVLESAGNGELQKHSPDSAATVESPEAIVGTALDAIDLSGSSGADPTVKRIRVEI